VFNQFIAYRDKKLSGVFVRFSCAASRVLVDRYDPRFGPACAVRFGKSAKIGEQGRVELMKA
jgi:hypothetical protein